MLLGEIELAYCEIHSLLVKDPVVDAQREATIKLNRCLFTESIGSLTVDDLKEEYTGKIVISGTLYGANLDMRLKDNINSKRGYNFTGDVIGVREQWDDYCRGQTGGEKPYHVLKQFARYALDEVRHGNQVNPDELEKILSILTNLQLRPDSLSKHSLDKLSSHLSELGRNVRDRLESVKIDTSKNTEFEYAKDDVSKKLIDVLKCIEIKVYGAENDPQHVKAFFLNCAQKEGISVKFKAEKPEIPSGACIYLDCIHFCDEILGRRIFHNIKVRAKQDLVEVDYSIDKQTGTLSIVVADAGKGFRESISTIREGLNGDKFSSIRDFIIKYCERATISTLDENGHRCAFRLCESGNGFSFEKSGVEEWFNEGTAFKFDFTIE